MEKNFLGQANNFLSNELAIEGVNQKSGFSYQSKANSSI